MRNLKQTHTRVCRTPFWTHVSDIVLGTYSDLFKLWESIPPEMEKFITAKHVDRLVAIDCQDGKAPAATWRDPEMVTDDEDV